MDIVKTEDGWDINSTVISEYCNDWKHTWRDRIWKNFLNELHSFHTSKITEGFNFTLSSKEKYGRLVVDFSSGFDEMYDMADKLAEVSSKTCIECWKTWEILLVNGWYKPLCEEHKKVL